MTRDEAVARIHEGLGFRSDLTSKIQTRLQEAQRNLENGKTKPWFLKNEDATINLVAGTPDVNLPTGFMYEDDDEWMRYTPAGTSTSQRIYRKTLGEAIGAYSASDPAGPKVYVLRNTTLKFFPTPDQAYTLTWSYWAHDVVLDSNVTNKWLTYAIDWIVGEAGLRMAADLRDQDAAATFMKMSTTGMDAVIRENAARAVAGAQPVMGGNN